MQPNFPLHRTLAALVLGSTLSLAAQAMPESDPAPPLSREAVHDALAQARATNRLTPPGEIGDTPEVLAQREAFNALQAEVLTEQADRQALAEEIDAADGRPVAITSRSELIALMELAAERGQGVVMIVDENAMADDESDIEFQ